MTSSPTSRSLGQAQIIPSTQDVFLIRSRESGDVVIKSHLEDPLVAKRTLPEAKPWAYFIAGAYMLLAIDLAFHALLIR